MNVSELLAKHELGKKALNDLCSKTNTWIGRDSSGIYDSISRQQKKLREIENIFESIRIYKYQVSFGCTDERTGIYLADTVQELHRKIEDDSITDDYEKNCLKNGYFREFADGNYETKDYVIDNAIHFIWRVNY